MSDDWLSDAAYRGLLDDVVANPDDDTPRLVMADWLEEHGHDARARLIRLQIERAGLSEHDRRSWECRAEEAALLAEHEEAWLGRLKKMVTRVEWRRGFVERVALGVNQMAKHAADVFSLTPVYHIQIMRLSQSKLPMADVAAIAPLSRTRSLCLRGSNLGDERLAELLNAVAFPHLEELDLSDSAVGERTLEAIQKRIPASLRSLSLNGNRLPARFPEIARRLAGHTLHELDLGGTGMRGEDVNTLAEWPGLASIRRLGLAVAETTVAPCVRLFNSPHLGPLERLDLACVAVGTGGMRALVESTRLASLRTLRLAGCRIGRGGFEVLAGGGLTKLEALDLASNKIGLEAVWVLASWAGLAAVRSLHLSYSQIGDAGMEAVLGSAHLGPLTRLDVAYCDLTPTAVRHLIACPALSSLARLDLSINSRIRAEHLGDLLASPTFAGLLSLGIEGLRLPAGYEHELRGKYPAL